MLNRLRSRLLCLDCHPCLGAYRVGRRRHPWSRRRVRSVHVCEVVGLVIEAAELAIFVSEVVEP